MNSENVISAAGLSLKLNKKAILKNIDFSVKKSEIVSIIGPNGAGKSSLLRCLSGDLTPSYDALLILNRPQNTWNQRQLACVLACLPQHSQLDFPLTVREVVSLARIPHQTGKQKDENVIEEVLAKLDLTGLAGANYLRLSGGEQRRVQLARVVAQLYPLDDGAKLLLLDEPCAGLDLKHQKLLADYLQYLQQHAVAVVVSAHDLNWAAKISNKMLALGKGRVEGFDQVNKILQAEFLQSLFDVPFDIDQEKNIVSMQ